MYTDVRSDNYTLLKTINVFFIRLSVLILPKAKGFPSFMSDRHPVAQNPLSFCILENKYLYNHYCRLKRGII